MGLFDTLQLTANTLVKNTMGYPASWGAYTATVLLNKPTQKDGVSDQDYQALTAKMEIFEGDFPGLYDSVHAGNNEFVTVAGVQYNVYHVEKKFDGKTIVFNVEPA